MSCYIGDNENPLPKLKSKLGFYHVVPTTTKTSPKKFTLLVVELQQLPDLEKTVSPEETSCLKWTIYKGERKVCENFKTDTDKLIIVVYLYRNNLYVKDNEIDLKLTKHQLLSANWFFCDTFTYLTSSALHWMKQLFIFKTNSVLSGRSLSNHHFTLVPRFRFVIWAK